MTPEAEAQRRITTGEWKADMRHLVSQAIQSDDAVIEAGSGFGVVTEAISQAGGVTIGFEPNPYLCNIARVRLTGRGSTYVRWGAVWTRSGWGEMEEPPGELWRGRLRVHPEGSVPVERLDDVIESVNARVIVLDCEGGEYTILTGSRLPGVRTILVELHGEGEENEQLAEHLRGRGYTRRGVSERTMWDNVTEWWERE